MKHAHLVLSEELLEQTLKASGERTYSAAVTRAMETFVRQSKARKIFELAGSGLWEGNLSEMRDDYRWSKPETSPTRTAPSRPRAKAGRVPR